MNLPVVLFEVVADEQLVTQVEDDAEDTLVTRIPQRAGTSSDWPPEPPLPAEVAEVLAEGTDVPQRNARIYAAVRRPTTSS